MSTIKKGYFAIIVKYISWGVVNIVFGAKNVLCGMIIIAVFLENVLEKEISFLSGWW